MWDNMTREERIEALKESIEGIQEAIKLTPKSAHNYLIKELTINQIALTVVENNLIKYE